MKLFIQLLMLLLVRGFASIYLLKNPDGSAVADTDSIMQRLNLSALLDSIASLSPSPATDIATTRAENVVGNDSTEPKIFRWQDAQGGVHFNNVPPPGIEAEVVDLSPLSVLTLYRGEPESSSTSQNGNTAEQQDSQTNPMTAENTDSLLPEQLTDVQEALQNAVEVARQFQEKLREQKQILDSL